ncbi:thioredoxin domain-containing protein [Salicibibacter halophilus]|uniref:Thioredoxin domain-containing protein n=1 Tax=Salicibibacter halophilus TaxID=2502791 RepID=A0A514LGL1_9BACI|nr:thioredoxin domain-containing protein [Salicibibacter halophilus]QDI90987.1 thioredoxin domain-containing protein [Salicibibacter halophilus]
MSSEMSSNALIHAKSPYLLQHAFNPVDWHEWGEEAFAKAKAENKPVFLSIGYSTCHWCHVMAHESFEDEEVAALLNKDFVSIKVDREERPDIDSIYMDACQAMNGHGGWPLTAFLTADQAPFYVATYLPKKSLQQMPGMLDALPQLAEQYHKNRDRITDIAGRVKQALSEGVKQDPEDIGAHTLENAYTELKGQFDQTYGGLEGEPKFPMPQHIFYLFRYAAWANDSQALEMAKKTLKQMRDGGIYDHIGGGFARYSVDHRWLVPHFEKMLYDNALLALAYTEGYQVTGDASYKQTAKEILDYVSRGMRDEQGGFFSAEDADSEGEEGKFYVWTKTEILGILGDEDGALFCDAYGISETGNFEGKNIPNQIDADEEKIETEHGLSDETLEQRLQASRAKLFDVRERRVHPHKDDKILTSWNGFMIAAYAKAGAAFAEPVYIERAKDAYRFLASTMFEGDRLMVRYREGKVKEKGFIDDYANVLWASLELYHATYEGEYLQQANHLAREMKRLFQAEDGVFYFTGTDAEPLLTRPSSLSDGAAPAGNSVAAVQLLRLADIMADQGFFNDVHELLRTTSWRLERYSIGHLHLLQALLMREWRGKTLVIVAGDDGLGDDSVIRHLRTAFTPHIQPLVIREGEKDVPAFAKDFTAIDGKNTYYLCENFACKRPTTNGEELLKSLW